MKNSMQLQFSGIHKSGQVVTQNYIQNYDFEITEAEAQAELERFFAIIENVYKDETANAEISIGNRVYCVRSFDYIEINMWLNTKLIERKFF